MRLKARFLLASLMAWSSGCSWMWPTVVPASAGPGEPLFHAGFPLGEGARFDGALCSLVTLGPDATRVVSEPERMDGAVSLEVACREGPPSIEGRSGRTARLVHVDTALGPMHGYLFALRPATGLVVAFTGLGMPPAGWINERFAEVGARKGFVTFAPVRDEAARPIYFDPLREGRRAIDAARQVAAACRIGAPADLAFVGISLGGLEALLANRDALRHGMSTRAAVLDPVLDVRLAAANLDSPSHSPSVDSVQGYFRRILTGRYHEASPPSFREVMDRTATHPEALTDLGSDAPSAWLCKARREAYAIFLSDTDPALGDAQREFAQACGFPLRKARVPGHTPLACRLEIFEEMLGALRQLPELSRDTRSLPGRDAREGAGGRGVDAR
jgi:hypothetical protein